MAPIPRRRPPTRLRDAGYGLYLAAINLLLNLPGHSYRVVVFRSAGRNSVGRGTSIERGVRVTSKGGITIGRDCNINRGTLLDGRGSLVIGDSVNISNDVKVLTAGHDLDDPEFAGEDGPVSIGDRSWLATGAMVLPGVTLGEGVVVAAGAVVANDIPPWSVVAGNPARVLRARSPDAQRVLPRNRRWFH